MEEDNDQAFYWFSQSAGKEYHRAEFFLGECYENGYGVKKDLRRAVEYYIKAHEGRRSDGTFALAACFEKGLGVKADPAKALALYQEAAGQGHKEAQEAVQRLTGKKKRRFPWQKK